MQIYNYIRQHDKQAHFFAMLSLCLVLANLARKFWVYGWQQQLIITLFAAGVSFVWEYFQRKIQLRIDGVKYPIDKGDILAFFLGIVAFNIIIRFII